MQIPGAPAVLFLGWLFILWPWAAIKSSRKIRATSPDADAAPAPSRETIWKNTLVAQIAVFAFAWWVASGFEYEIFALPPLGLRELLAALAALALLFLLRALVRASRSEAERRKLAIYRITPRTRREWILWCATVLAASISEEAAYRGVAMQILWWSLGNPWIAACLVATAFAAAHWLQGWKSMAIIFLISLVMQGLVAFTQTLVLAMVVHAIYDLVAGEHIRREAIQLEAQPPRP